MVATTEPHCVICVTHLPPSETDPCIFFGQYVIFAAQQRPSDEHTAARERGRAVWYEAYTLRVAKVERACGFRA